MKWSKEAQNIIRFMLKQLSSCKYCYRHIIEGCYLSAILHYNFKEPKESQNSIITYIIIKLNIL